MLAGARDLKVHSLGPRRQKPREDVVSNNDRVRIMGARDVSEGKKWSWEMKLQEGGGED